MKSIYRMALAAWAGVAILAIVSTATSAQEKARTLKQQLIGTWTVVSIVNDMGGGDKKEPFGPNPLGYIMFDRGGHYSAIVVRPGRPKFASNSRVAGSAEENKAAVQGSISTFGTYSVNEKDHSVTVHILGSSYPNWDGTVQKRFATVSGDELKYSDPTPSAGSGTVIATLKRAK